MPIVAPAVALVVLGAQVQGWFDELAPLQCSGYTFFTMSTIIPV
jgi:hypothetical protein